jgi:hypothetical protein
MINENVKARGVVAFTLVDENGNTKESGTHNLVVDAGLAFIASRMKDATAAVMSHMAVGTGTTAASDAQTALVTEAARVALTSTTQVTTTVTNDSIQYVATFNPGTGTGALTEAGLFNNAAGGSMLARTVFPVINKGALDTLSITWKVTVA